MHNKRTINKIILHCSDSDIEAHDNIQTIRRWHIQRGWRDVGYHWFIDKKGGLFSGRPEWMIGVHTLGYNHDSLGICLSGRDDFKKIQFEICAQVVDRMMHDYNLSIDVVGGHNEYDKERTCPRFKIEEVTSRIYGPFRQ